MNNLPLTYIIVSLYNILPMPLLMSVRVIQLYVCFMSCLLAFMPVDKIISAHKAFAKPAPNPRGLDAVIEEGHVDLSYRAA